jgi:hypothetical protein
MEKPRKTWTLLGILAGLGGVAAAIAGWRFPHAFLSWIASGSIGVSGAAFLIAFLSWAVSRLTWKDWLLAIFSSALITLTILTALQWTRIVRGPQAKVAATLATPIARKHRTDASGMDEARKVSNVTVPGYTSTVLMQLDRHGWGKKDFVFKDTSADGSEVSLATTDDNGFTFVVKIMNGETYSLDIPSGPEGIPLDQNVYIACVAGNTKSSGFLRVLVDGDELFRRDFDLRIEFGNRQWKSTIAPDRTKLQGVLASTEDRLLAAWALSDDKLAEQETNFRYAHADSFNGDDSLLYAPLGTRRIGPSPASGTFMQLTMPPE